MFCRSNIVNKWLECKKLWEISDSQAYTTWIKCSGLPLLAAVASTSHWDGVKTNPHAVEHRQRGGERCHSFFFFFMCTFIFHICKNGREVCISTLVQVLLLLVNGRCSLWYHLNGRRHRFMLYGGWGQWDMLPYGGRCDKFSVKLRCMEVLNSFINTNLFLKHCSVFCSEMCSQTVMKL